MLLNCGVGEDCCESLGLQGDPTSLFWRRLVLGIHWKDWCWGWNSNTLATSWEELTHWKRLWCWEGLEAGGEGDDRGWDGWMASPTWCTWVWVNSGSWWWTGRPGVLQFMGLQRVGHEWAIELNWTDGYMPRNGIAGSYGSSNTFYQVISAGVFTAVSASAGLSHPHSFPPDSSVLESWNLYSHRPSPRCFISHVVSTMQSAYIHTLVCQWVNWCIPQTMQIEKKSSNFFSKQISHVVTSQVHVSLL